MGRWTPALSVVVLAGAVVAWSLVIGAAPLPPHPHPPPSVAGAAGRAPALPSSAPAAAQPSVGALTAPTGTPNLAGGMVSHALAATRAAGLSPVVAYVPHPSAAPAQVRRTQESGVVSPFYISDPAPMGVTDYGLSGDGSGPVTGTITNTTEVVGEVDLNSTGIVGMDLYQATPDAFSIQLNAVLTNVMLFGTPGYTFWTQNVVTYYPSTGLMLLITNIWNFSGEPLSGNAIYSHGPFAVGNPASLGYYAAEDVLASPVTYPFNVSLLMVSLLTPAHRNWVLFNVSLVSSTDPSENFGIGLDDIVFNSTSAAHPLGAARASNYTADGEGYNPIGLTDDFELIVGGPGGGSQVDLSAADAQLGLSYLYDDSIIPVPSAYNYGGDSGETDTGADVAWTEGAGGPYGDPTYATMSTGPAILSGLWGTGAPEGSYPLTLDVTPANAFTFFAYNGTGNSTAPFESGFEFAPSITTQTFYLMPGEYFLQSELSDHEASAATITVAGPLTVTVTLALDTGLRIYTPLWAFSNAELPAISSGGAGTPADPYVLYNAQTAPIWSAFGLYNDLGFPVFPGVFLYHTTASVEIYKPPSFVAHTNDLQVPGPELPQNGDLQYWFWGVSNAALVDAANISGWYALSATDPLIYNTFDVIFYESSHNLIAGNRFPTDAEALLLYSGGSPFGPENIGGGDNTVWGNQFLEQAPSLPCAPGATCLSLYPFGLGLGMEVGEDHDVIYNNLFATPTTAWLLPLNLQTGGAELFEHELWNITPQAATNVHYAVGFPTVPLSGSIVGGKTQGGNSWWDYGLLDNWYNGADNPLGQLPYDENAVTLLPQLPTFGCVRYYCATYIYPAGDEAPLTTENAPVLISEQGLVPGAVWGAVVTCAPTHISGGNTSSSGNPCCAPTHISGGNTSTSSPCCAPTHISGGNTSSSGPCCAPTHISGGNTSSSCGGAFVVLRFETTGRVFDLGSLPDGYYNWTPILPAGYASLQGGTFRVLHHKVHLVAHITILGGYSLVKVHETGLRKKTEWEFELLGTSPGTDAFNTTWTGTTATAELVVLDGSYTFVVPSEAGRTPVPAAGMLSVTGPAKLHIKFERPR